MVGYAKLCELFCCKFSVGSSQFDFSIVGIQKIFRKLEKQITLEEEKRIKEDKKLTRQVKMKEKVNKKQTKTPAKKDNKITDFENVPVFSTEFDKIVKRIKRRNILRPYPDINDIQN